MRFVRNPQRARSRWILAFAVAASTSIIAVFGASGESGGAARATSGAAICTAAEKAKRVKAAKKFSSTMAARRKAFFLAHKSSAARRAFVKSQQAKLKALRHAAACTVLPAGASIVAKVAVPKDGPLTLGLGSVWVNDREGGEINNGVPAGTLYRIDPQSVAVTDVIPHVLGGQSAVVANGSVWLPAFELNRLMRVDPGSHSVIAIVTGPSDDEGPDSAGATPGAIWVGNHHGGTIARIDSQTNALAATIPVMTPGQSGPQSLVTDGSGDVWFSSGRQAFVWRIDAATNAITSKTTIADNACGLVLDNTGFWYHGCAKSNVLVHVNSQTGAQTTVKTPGSITDEAVGLGSVWAVTAQPSALVRIDPQSNKVVGSLALHAGDGAIRIGEGAIWVRVVGTLFKVEPV